MRWLVYGNLSPAVKDALIRHEHSAEAADASDFKELVALAHKSQNDLLTNDKALVQHMLDHPAKFDRSLVHLQLAGGAVEQDDAIDRLFTRYKRLKPGMLYTVTETRVKIRQLPSATPFSKDD